MIYDIYLYTLCYYICCLLGACMRCTRLCSLKPGVTEVVSKQMLTVGRNLDRNGQPLPTYLLLIHSILTLLWFFLYSSWSCLTFYCSTLIILTFSTLRQDGFHTLESLPLWHFFRDRKPKTKLKLFSLLKMLVECSDDQCLICFFDWLKHYMDILACASIR